MADVKVNILEKDGVELDGPTEYTLVGADIPIDNTGLNYYNNRVQSVLEELKARKSWKITSTTTTASGTLNLTTASTSVHVLMGSATDYSIKLPDATGLFTGDKFEVINESTKTVFIKDNSGTILAPLLSGDSATILLLTKSTAVGTWSVVVTSSVATGVQAFNVVSSVNFQTSNSTDTLITGMTLTPVTGTYGVWFSADIVIGANNRIASGTLYKAGVAVTNTKRTASGTGSNYNGFLTMLGIIQVDGTQAIDVRVNVTAGTLDVNQRSLLIIRLGA